MPIHNADLAAAFNEIADLQEILGENPFRIRAYRNAARVIEDAGTELHERLARGDDLTEMEGIGKDLAAKIAQYVSTGHLPALEELRKRLPAGVTAWLSLPGLGPKRVKTILDELKIGTLEELEAAARGGRLRTLKGFGEKIEATVLESIARKIVQGTRFRRAAVQPYAEALAAHLRQVNGVQQVELAGSYRRGRETVGDLDLVAVAGRASPVMQRFVDYDEVEQVLAHGETKSSVRLRSGIQADLRVVSRDSFGSAMHYFTGSQAHNIALRRRAQERGLKLNEYGLLRGEETVAGRSEEELFAALGLAWIPPELREDRGEVEAAEAGRLPGLVQVTDLRGDLHTHTDWSDGAHTIEQMARAARARGYAYYAITDHSKRLTVANGLDEERVRRQWGEIDKVNKLVKGIELLRGIEVDILEDGSLDLEDELLAGLDLVVASVHSKFNLSRERQTARILKALDHPSVNILAHPTGRLLLQRDGYDIDLPAMLARARERGVAVELNANPMRLDLDDRACRMAREAGVLVSIDSDAHRAEDLDLMRHGVSQARRAWLEPRNVLNARPLPELKAFLRKGR